MPANPSVNLLRRLAALLLPALLSGGVTFAAPTAPATPAAPSGGGPGTPVLLHTFNHSTVGVDARAQLIGPHFYKMADGEVWRSDGTVTGTVALDYYADTGILGSPLFYVADNSRRFFLGYTSGSSPHLWTTFDTPASTHVVSDFVEGPSTSYLSVLGNRAIFAADDGGGVALWQSDGTLTGTARFYAFDAPGNIFPQHFLRLGSRLFFNGPQGATAALWVSDGTPGGTVPLANFGEPSAYPAPWPFFGWNQRAFVAARIGPGVTKFELWASDGTAAGTQMLPGIELPGPSNGYDGYLADTKLGWLAARSEGPLNGFALYRTDGTPAGTNLLRALTPRLNSSAPPGAATLNGQFYFVAAEGGSDYTLWRTDGTPAGTVPVNDLGLDSEPCGFNFAAHGGYLYFTTHTALWRTDGTAAGTDQIAAGFPCNATLTWVYHTLFIAGLPSGDVWVSDGLPGGLTEPLVENSYPPGVNYSRCCWQHADQVFFVTDGDAPTIEKIWGVTVTPFAVASRSYLPAIGGP